MDLTRFEINRRTALLTSAAIAANVINPMRAFAQETPRKGGVSCAKARIGLITLAAMAADVSSAVRRLISRRVKSMRSLRIHY